MTLLADALEAVFRSQGSFGSVELSGTARGERHRVWLVRPDRFRWERDVPGGTMVTVQVGTRWWLEHPVHGRHTNHGDAHAAVDHGPFEFALDPRPLLADTLLEAIGTEERAGRPAIVLSARPRDPEGFHARRWGVDEPSRIAIDAERGVVLDGLGPTVERIAFDVDVAPEMFAPLFDDADAPEWTGRVVTLEEARALVPFPVLVPTLMPAGSRLVQAVVSGLSGSNDRLRLSYVVDPGARNSFDIDQGRDAAEEDRATGRDWRTERHGSEEILVREDGDPGDAGYRAAVLVERPDTPYALIGNLPLDAIVAIAMSMKPAE